MCSFVVSEYPSFPLRMKTPGVGPGVAMRLVLDDPESTVEGEDYFAGSMYRKPTPAEMP